MEQNDKQQQEIDAVEEEQNQPNDEPTTTPDTPDEIALAGYETINYLIQRGLLEKR